MADRWLVALQNVTFFVMGQNTEVIHVPSRSLT